MKQLLLTVFYQVHKNLIAKQQALLHMQLNPYTLPMYYPNTTSTYNIQQNNASTSDQMKKYIESKSYPYYFMNPQINQSLGQSINPQMGMPMSMPMPIPNPYMNYNTNPSINPNFNQFGGLPKNLTGGISYSVNPYSSGTNLSTLCHPQFMGTYNPNLINGYGQRTPHPLSQYYNAQKADFSRNSQPISLNSVNQNIQKKLIGYSDKEYLSLQRIQKEKLLQSSQKDLRLMNQPTKVGNGIISSSNSKTDQNYGKKESLNFLPKKLPYKDTKKLSQSNSLLKNCACKGYFEYDNFFTCTICLHKFHYKCLGLPEKGQEYQSSQISCAHCKLRKMDPLNKVEKIIGEFYLMNLYENNFQAVVNFRPYDHFCRQKNSKYEIELRCIRAGDHMKNLEITWPDECIIKINNQKIVDIPALQNNSSLKKRKDYSVFITHNIYSKSALVNPELLNLQKIKFSLQLKTLTSQQISSKKIRNQFTFALGIYLIEKLNTDELYAKIVSQQKIQNKDFLKNLMKSSQNEIQIDKITIRLTDPFSWDLIKTPVRGYKCIHAQCFDLKTFISLMFSAKNRTWRCPLCSKDCRKFMLDHQQQDILKKAQQLDPAPKQVSIYKDGKVAFSIQKDSQEQNQNQGPSNSNKTKKIKKQQVPKSI